ncbi:bifunctional precorrin-2 dehydrogenase/sirohydrochlorin ferrochelatase [Thermodesulfobacteriota bacterium]
MPYYPVFLDLRGRKVLVVGGGEVAQRKVDTLLQFGAEVYIVSRELSSRLSDYEKTDRVKVLGPEFHEDHLEGSFLVIAATDDPDLNHLIGEKAKEQGLLINAVDQPVDCNFIVPSILSRGDLLIAVSTSGKSPALAKKIRKKLEKDFGSEYGLFLILMGHLREEILSRGLPLDENRRIFHELVDSNILDSIGNKDWEEVSSIIDSILDMEISREDVMVLLKSE